MRILRLKQHNDLILFVSLAVLFIQFPAIDIAFSSLFFTKEDGFSIGDMQWATFLYQLVPILVKLTLIFITLVIIANAIKKTPKIIQNYRKEFIYLLLVLLVGPGLLVNATLKENWNRARPLHTEAFGGNLQHTPAFIIGNNKRQGYSFVSGHASVGFFFISFYWFSKTRKKSLFLLGLLAGSVIGLARIAQGGHFLSDVIFSFFSVYFVAKFIAYLYLKPTERKAIE